MGRVSVWVGAAALAFGSASVVVFAAPAAQAAGLPPGCVVHGTDAVCTYTADGSFTVPAGLSEFEVVAVGGDGAAGAGVAAGGGGVGRTLDSTFTVGPAEPVSAGDTLSILIGGNASGPQGGAHGGGDAGFVLMNPLAGGGGGGATELDGQHPTASRLVVAAGGGGGGGGSLSSSVTVGGTGGDASGGNGANGAGVEGVGGFGGTGASGGVHGMGGAGSFGCDFAGTAGTDGADSGAGGNGGAGEGIGGGGGGAGFAGGGAGGGGGDCVGDLYGGGGGGAGSSFSLGATADFAPGDGHPRLVITFDASAISVTGLDPSITGLPQVGQTLTAHAGPVSPADSTLSYQWKADGVDISGATGPTLLLTPDLAGARIKVRIKATHAGLDSMTATSPATPYVRELVKRPQVVLDQSVVCPGSGPITGTAQGLVPGNTYTIHYLNQTLTRTADVYGEVHFPINVPAGTNSGPHADTSVSISGTHPKTNASALLLLDCIH